MSNDGAPSPDSLPLTAIPAWKKRLPMQLTWGRMAVCPIIVWLLAEPAGPHWRSWAAATFFILASITDWFDGHLARKYLATSNMGKFMDPIADKILVASVLVMLIPTGQVGPVLVLVLLARDILIGGIRSVAAADRVIIDAKSAGKWKTGLQMVGIPAVLLHSSFLGTHVYEIGLALLWVSVVLSLVSGYQYIELYAQSNQRAKSA
jgi:CDP-diacylglycerol--glycerol-3-phosphate 3-phosphatidyltransferase